MATEIERILEAITEEIYLQMTASGRQISAKDAPAECGCEHECADCGGPCSGTCAPKTRKIISAGACRVSVEPPVPGPLAADPALAALIDHTLLKPEATRDDIIRLCREARDYGFASVCVNACWVALAADQLRGGGVKVCTVAGFPLGATLSAVKRVEAAEAVKLGAQEVDMVINVGALRSGDYDAVRLDIRGVVEAAHAACAIVKVILETALLNDEEKVAGSMLAQAAGADFVKTSTGFGPGGATAHDIELMRFVVGDALGVKAAGGVRSLEDVKKMVSAGATRIGASASVKIMEEVKSRPDRTGAQEAAAPAAAAAY